MKNSIWTEEVSQIPVSGEMNGNVECDVCIIGSGIFGITTGYYLAKNGLRVAIIDKGEITSGTTRFTTAKITSQHSLLYHYLMNEYGKEYAKTYFDVNENAISQIQRNIEEENIDCNFERLDNYIYTIDQNNCQKIQEEFNAMQEIGADVHLTKNLDLPFSVELGIQLKNQAQFHPLKYIQGLAQFILKNGGKIYENVTCDTIRAEKNGYMCVTNSYNIVSKYVVVAAHYPFLNVPGFYFSKMYQSTSYVVATEIEKKKLSGMYISIDDPVLSFRQCESQGKTYILVGGASHKTGEEVTREQTYDVLKQESQKCFPEGTIKYEWATNDCITLDKVAYIGKFSNLMPNVFVATGFNKWGMTTSHVAASIVCDKIRGIKNQYAHIFESTRMNPVENRGEVKNMVVDTTKSLVADRVKESPLTIEDIANGSGGIIERDGKKIGVYKDENGNVTEVIPVCTHLGCMLKWNDADKTWDCHCHGSRFRYDGKNIHGPAIKDLDRRI